MDPVLAVVTFRSRHEIALNAEICCEQVCLINNKAVAVAHYNNKHKISYDLGKERKGPGQDLFTMKGH